MPKSLTEKAYAKLDKSFWALGNLIEAICEDLLGSDEDINSLIAETNACEWFVDTVEIARVDFLWNDGKCQPVVHAHFYLSGEQDEDKMFCGNLIEGCIDVVLLSYSTYEIHGVNANLAELDEERFSAEELDDCFPETSRGHSDLADEV